MNKASSSTQDYTHRLVRLQRAWHKRLLDVQRPYRWNLRRLNPGFTLDLGCGIGRNLINLGGFGVGIDVNAASVQVARDRGLNAFTPEEFRRSAFNVAERFDSLLLSHVAEHMTRAEVSEMLEQHLTLLKRGGRLILITPQESGFRSDPTHVEFMDFTAHRELLHRLGLAPVREYSFPFPRVFGRVFWHNEFVSVGRKP